MTLPPSAAEDPTEIVYDCSSCGRPIAIDVRAAGMEVACPYCAEKGIVPQSTTGEVPPPEPETEADPPEPAAGGEHELGDGREVGEGGEAAPFPRGGLPPKRKAGELPKHESHPVGEMGAPPLGAAASAGADKVTKGTGAVVGGAGDAILAGLAKGEIEVMPAKRVGRKTVFGCPLCSRPLEIKPRAEGKEMQCPECSGRLVAPDLKSGTEASALSGGGGKAGGVDLPGQSRDGHAHVSNRPGGDEAAPHPPLDEGAAKPVAGDPKSMAAHRLNADKIAKLVPRDEAEAGFHMEDAWASYPDASPIAHAWTSRLKPILLMAMLGLIAAGIVAGVMLMKRQQDVEIENAGEMAGEVEGQGEGGTGVPDSPAQVVLKAYEGFTEAETVMARLPFVRAVGDVEDAMKRFYGRTRNLPSFPPLDALSYEAREIEGVTLARINSLPAEGQAQRVFFFEILADGSARLDWESAVGYGDIPIKEFSTDLPTRAVEMRVMVRRSDYYNNEFRDPAVYSCYEITDLHRTAVIYGYALRESATDATLAQLLPEGASGWRNCILRLAPHESWERRDPPQLRIEEVVANGWLKM